MLFDCLNHKLEELDDGEDEGAEGQGAEMVAEDHFVGAEDGEVGFVLVGDMGVVPDATGAGDHEDSYCLDEGVAPQGAEQEYVEFYEGLVLQVRYACEYVSVLPSEGSC